MRTLSIRRSINRMLPNEPRSQPPDTAVFPPRVRARPTHRFPSGAVSRKSLLRDEPAEKCNGLLNRSNTKQHNYGMSGQVSWFGTPNGVTGGDEDGVPFDTRV